MTGPDYPVGVPAPGSNAIGTFSIGASPAGTIPSFDWWRTILSQYANSPIITGIVGSFVAALDRAEDLDAFFDKIWNVYTAEGVGLDCWGTIVAVNRVLKLPTGIQYLGFDEGGTLDYTGFNQAPWYSGQKLTDNYIMSDDGFRVLILAKALANICDGSIPAINTILRTLFGSSGKCYCVDLGGMEMQYKFEFVLSPLQYAIVTNSGVLPTPTGVSYTIVQP